MTEFISIYNKLIIIIEKMYNVTKKSLFIGYFLHTLKHINNATWY